MRRTTPKLRSVLTLFALVTPLLFSFAKPAAAALPTGFTDTLVTAVDSPTDLAFTPDGRMLITTKPGVLRVFAGGSLLATPALTLPAASICTDNERGLLGAAVDPAFATNHRIYLYYTFVRPADSVCVNRVSRFLLPDGNVVDPTSEVVLLDNMSSRAGNHNAGDVDFGKDGYLYISIGDGGCNYADPESCAGENSASRDQNMLIGKIMRITTDGGIPPSNPFQGAGTARCNVDGRTTPGLKCQETFAWGLRNPFRFAFDPNAADSRFFINDVGQEIDLGQAGADYGWNCREGRHVNSTSGPCSPTPVGMVDPIFEYDHFSAVPGTDVGSCGAVTGGAFVPNGLWPGFDGDYLFSDYNCGAIFILSDAGASGTVASFDTDLGSSSAVAMTFGPWASSQALYYTSYADGGQVRRISYSNGNNPPVAVASGSPLYGPVPLNVTFDATGSSDPDAGDTLTYFWTFGDGTPEVSTTSLTIQHSYTTAGVYTAQLRVEDNHSVFSPVVTLQVQPGNQPPVPTITSPSATATFRVGQAVTLTGTATDPQDGTLPASSLSWTILLHHNSHTHPFLGPVTGNNIQITTPHPEDLAAAVTSYLEIRLTATDSQGLATTTVRNFQPHKVAVTFATAPSGLTVNVEGIALTGPQTVTSWENWGLNVDAPSQPGPGGATYVFASWSDGGGSGHTLVTPAADATYTATFQPSRADGPTDYTTVTPCRAVDTRGANGPALAAGATRPFTLTGVCGVPADAKAVAVNVAVVPSLSPPAAGYLSFRRGDEIGTGASLVNFTNGLIRSSDAILPLGAAGDVKVLCGASGPVHLVIDIVGYFN
jgi:glucose/arabinose dehydrogenase